MPCKLTKIQLSFLFRSLVLISFMVFNQFFCTLSFSLYNTSDNNFFAFNFYFIFPSSSFYYYSFFYFYCCFAFSMNFKKNFSRFFLYWFFFYLYFFLFLFISILICFVLFQPAFESIQKSELLLHEYFYLLLYIYHIIQYLITSISHRCSYVLSFSRFFMILFTLEATMPNIIFFYFYLIQFAFWPFFSFLMGLKNVLANC